MLDSELHKHSQAAKTYSSSLKPLQCFLGDPSFKNSLTRLPKLEALLPFLPPNLTSELEQFFNRINDLPSSYALHHYGYLFYALTRWLKPQVVIELGMLKNYSSFAIAAGLRTNGNGKLHGFDLFEDYQYHSDTHANIMKRIADYGFSDLINATKGDALSVHKQFSEIDILHIDLSNNGEIVTQCFNDWQAKTKQAIIIEGGHAARDQVEWMIKYQKPAINPALQQLQKQYPEWDYFILAPYPSITVFLRKTLLQG